MLPALAAERLVIAIRLRYKPGDVVVVRHNGREKIKRLHSMQDDQVFLLGDNPPHSTDSRHFGWLSASVIVGKVVWPRTIKRAGRV
jgi:nickel-type superoxide dismutase maturation protease